MKFSKLAIGLLGLSLAACSSEEPNIVTPEENVTDGNSRYMSVTIRNANGGRAAGDQTDGTEDLAGSKFEEGLSGENKINTLRFYFFDDNGNAVPVKSSGFNYYDCTEITEAGPDMPNVEQTLSAVIVISTQAGDNLDNLRKMVAVANMPAADLGSSSLSLSQLQKIVGAYDANSEKSLTSTSKLDYMPMTSSVFGTGAFDCAAEILPSNICQTEAEAKDNAVDIYIERIQAKVRVSTVWDGTMKTTDLIYNDKTYKAVQLYSRTTSEGATTTSPIKVDDKDVYAIFTGWCPTGVAKKSYAFKHFDAAWSLGWDAAKPASHRSFWAENPFAEPDANTVATTEAYPLKFYTPADAIGTFGSKTVTSNTTTTYDGSFYYIQENAATPDKNGEKLGFNPATQVSNRTQVLLCALLVTNENGTAKPIELSEWGGRKYTDTDIVSAMLNVVKNQVYLGKKTIKTEGDVTNEVWEFKTLETSDVELKSATDIFGDDYFDASDDLRYLTYIQLKEGFTFPEGYEQKFYKSIPPAGQKPTAVNEYDNTDAVNVVLRSTPGAKVWKSGMTYYYTDIRHESTAADTKGRFGVVRNHIYDIELNSVYGLGTPIYDPEDDTVIIPQKPKDLDSFIGARINVLSWRVISQGVTLDW